MRKLISAVVVLALCGGCGSHQPTAPTLMSETPPVRGVNGSYVATLMFAVAPGCEWPSPASIGTRLHQDGESVTGDWGWVSPQPALMFESGGPVSGRVKTGINGGFARFTAQFTNADLQVFAFDTTFTAEDGGSFSGTFVMGDGRVCAGTASFARQPR